MKKVKFFKVGVIFSLLLFFCTNLNAENYILNDDKLIDDRAKEKINQIGDEVKSKLKDLTPVERYNKIKKLNLTYQDIYTEDEINNFSGLDKVLSNNELT